MLAIVLGSTVFSGRGEAEDAPARTTGSAKNAIFTMGDGMGPAHRDAIQLATVCAYDRLAMDQLPIDKSGQKLDQSVTVAGRFAERDKKTLQIVTADHECGGLTVEEPSNSDESGAEIPGNISGEDGPFDVANSDYQFFMDWTTTGHTGVDVPLTARARVPVGSPATTRTPRSTTQWPVPSTWRLGRKLEPYRARARLRKRAARYG